LRRSSACLQRRTISKSMRDPAELNHGRSAARRLAPQRMTATRLGGMAGAMAAVLFVPACSGFVGEAYVNRRAHLAARVVTSDGQTGVPCKVTALLFGEQEGQAEIASGADAMLMIGMMTPAKVDAPVKANVALRVACRGYVTVTTPAREVEVSALDPPTVDFGTVAASVSAP
jgi:hypothetical protein